jgi:(E)-4-hydroxy-3-methylbut-2-enyl-diphosphate synthase
MSRSSIATELQHESHSRHCATAERWCALRFPRHFDPEAHRRSEARTGCPLNCRALALPLRSLSMESAVRRTRRVQIGRVVVGAGEPVAVQSMCATKTRDIDATVAQVHQLAKAGADIVRIAVDSETEVAALKDIRALTQGVTLSVDLQENYRLAASVAPHVDKIRYNPGHLHHVERDKPIAHKVTWIASVARDHDCAIRIGVNCGSVAPEFVVRYPGNQLEAIVQSALYHCDLMESAGFDRFLVSLKDSDAGKVVAANTRFATARPDVPLHLGVTEAGLPPDGIIKTRLAFEKLLATGIGDTIRVSLTLPNDRKHEEVAVGYEIIRDVAHGRFISVPDFGKGLNIISCPSCSRVENESFVELAQQVKALTAYAAAHRITIAVMGCRVNGPGETDDADLGLWCGPSTVNLKRKDVKVGTYGYAEVLPRLRKELDRLIAERSG